MRTSSMWVSRGDIEGPLTWLSRPMVKSMRKKRMAHRGEMGSRATASGYTTNVRPGPATGCITNVRQGVHHKRKCDVVRVRFGCAHLCRLLF